MEIGVQWHPCISQKSNHYTNHKFELSIGQILYELPDMHGSWQWRVWRRLVDTTENKGKNYRPHFNTRLCISTAEYSQMSLYDWSDYRMLKNVPKNMNKFIWWWHKWCWLWRWKWQSDFHHFLKDHPLYHSTHVTLLDNMQEWVPNLFGGAIPRRDHGDREFTALLCWHFLNHGGLERIWNQKTKVGMMLLQPTCSMLDN